MFGVGEHHRADFAVSAPEVVLAAIAGRTKRIRLGSAVTVLSTDEPVRVYERFSTLDALSNGRAEVIVGRGSFTETFPLFGFDLAAVQRAVRRAPRAVCGADRRATGHLVWAHACATHRATLSRPSRPADDAGS